MRGARWGATLSPYHDVVPAKAGSHRATHAGLWDMGPRFRGDDSAEPYALAFAHRSGRSAFFQSGMAEIFFSRSSTSASLCRPGVRSGGKPGATSTRASALAKVSRDML